MTTPKAYREDFASRVKWARENAGYMQTEIAELLGISQPTYSKYETRGDTAVTLMPHHLIKPFCMITRVSQEWLLSGEGMAHVRPHSRARRA